MFTLRPIQRGPGQLVHAATTVVACLGLVAPSGCASPTPVPTATPEPTATTAPPTPTETIAATATISATATTEATAVPPTAAPTQQSQSAATKPPAAAAAPKPTAVPPAPAYDVKWWADKAHLDREENCTQINWEVIGAKQVFLQWPHQEEHEVEAKGRQDYVCISEGETAVFRLRMVKQDGSIDVRDMTIVRDEE